MKTFPNHFSLKALTGYRAKQHLEREDAFQQLVGDGLREDRGGDIVVAPTKGADGSIDAFVPSRGGDTAPYLRLPTPLIVECKDHDDELAEVAKNVRTGWAKMVAKLGPKAQEGWPDAYAPWKRARGYLYCVSAVLPSQSARDKLQEEIETFFADLRRRGLCTIESVRIMDWSDIRAWLDRMPRVADHWLGVGLPGLLPQEEFVRRLSGFQQYLLEEHLPFVAPEQGGQTHPDVLWQRLQARAGTGGMLLVGPGGVGKSRTLMETAKRAVQAGWRALHALPGERALTVEALAEELLAGHQPTLLLLDYLDQMPSFDLEAFRRRLLPAATERGIPIALLASARPGYLRRPVLGREDFLGEPVWLRPGVSQRLAITQQVVERIAPMAISLSGLETVKHICGERPIIALFIALELERNAKNGQLTAALLEDLRSGDLVSWLQRRLREDDLTVATPESPFDLAEPAPKLIVAALALAAAPQREEALTLALTTTLREVQPAAQEVTARHAVHVLRTLEQLGWLERDGVNLAAAHDVVVEEVLEEVLRERHTNVVRGDVLGILLSAGRSSPRTLGRLTTSLGRLVSQEPDAAPFERELQGYVVQWFEKSVTELGKALLTVPADEASYALGAVVAGAAGADLLVRHWGQLLQPWVERSGLLFEARHLLYRALKLLPAGHQACGSLIQTALRWLQAHGREADASYVLGGLLSRGELAEATPACTEHAVRWLEAHGDGIDARFVLRELLSRRDLGPIASSCIEQGLRWIKAHKGAEASYVLEALLSRRDLEKDAQICIEHAMRWLGSHAPGMEARFVLKEVLKLEDLGDRAPALIAQAVRWLESHAQSAEAAFVLEGLLSRNDLGETAPTCLQQALKWLGEHGQSDEAGFVLNELLTRRDLGPLATSCIERALHWLDAKRGGSEASYVLKVLLPRDDLKEATPTCIEYALRWLEAQKQHADAQFVLKVLLIRKDLGAAAERCIEQGVRWLEAQKQHVDAQFVLKVLLIRKDLGAAAERCIEQGVRWLEVNGQDAEATYILKALLSREDLGEAASTCIGHAVRWLEAQKPDADTQFVVRVLLARKDLGESAATCIRHAVRWLESHALNADARFVVKELVSRRDLGEAVPVCIRHTLRWLGAHGQDPEAAYVLSELLPRGDLGEAAPACIRYAMGWLEARGPTAAASYVLSAMLSRDDLGEATPACIGHAVRWLDAQGQGQEAWFVIRALLVRSDLGKAAPKCIEHAVRWLDSQKKDTDTQHICRALLARKDLGQATPACLGHAVRWLETHWQGAEARFVLKDLLSRSDLKDAAPECIRLAVRWLEVHDLNARATHVLGVLLTRNDLQDLAAACISHAMRWLEQYDQESEASFVLQPLLSRKDLKAFAPPCIAHTVRWLEVHGLQKDAAYVLPAVLSRRAVNDPWITSAAIAWVKHHPKHPRAASLLDRLLNDRQLPDSQWQEAAGLMMQGLQDIPGDKGRVLDSLLRRPQLLGTHRAEVETRVLAWAQSQVPASSAAKLLLKRLQKSPPSPGRPQQRQLRAHRNTAQKQARNDRPPPQVPPSFANIINQVNALAASAAQAPQEFMGSALARAAREVDSGNLKLVNFSIPGLLALASRSGDPALLKQARQLTQRVLSHERLEAKQREGISNACQRLVDSGAWPDRAQGMKFLRELGLSMPPRNPRAPRRRS